MFTKFFMDKMDKKLHQQQQQQQQQKQQQQQQQQQQSQHQQQHQHHSSNHHQSNSNSHSHPFHNLQTAKTITNPLQAKLVALETKLKHNSMQNMAATTTPTTTSSLPTPNQMPNAAGHIKNASKANQHNQQQQSHRHGHGHGRDRDRDRNHRKYDSNITAFNRYCVPSAAGTTAGATGQTALMQQPVIPLLTQVQRVSNDLTDKLTRLARRNTLKFRELAALQMHDKNAEALQELQTSIPEITKIFDVHCRIGSGTFSTVLLGTLQRERQLPETQRRRFAIKHHNPTNHPERILRELECMFRMGGENNVIGINCCIRYNDNVAFVMPFMSHDRFHDVYRELSLMEIKDYLRNLLIALRHVHKFNVIHRDVKPSNILYNRRTGKFLLCDFGLAQRLAEDGSLIQASDLSGAAALLRDMDAAQQQLLLQDNNSLHMEAEAAALRQQQSQQPNERRTRAVGGGTNTFESSILNMLPEPTKKELAAQKADTQRLINRLRFINVNVDPNNYVVSTNNTRKEMHASRAGTPGYRPPEVLLRYPHQTTAVDVWAVGVIMLSMLSSLHPFFKAPNDCAALTEIMNLFGDLQVRKTAFMLDRLVLITQKVSALDLRRVCMRFRYASHFLSPEIHRRHRRADGFPELCRHCEQATFNCICKHTNHQLETYEGLDMFPHQAYDLLARLLEVNPQKRITAEEALKHPFFSDSHRIVSGLPLHQQHVQLQQQSSLPNAAQLRARDSLQAAGSRTLTPFISYPNSNVELNSRTPATTTTNV